MSTSALIQQIRHSIEVLLSIKNEQGANNMTSSMINDDSALNRSTLSDRLNGSPASTNPFDKVKVKDDIDGQRGARKENKRKKEENGPESIKSQSLFSNYYSGKHNFQLDPSQESSNNI